MKKITAMILTAAVCAASAVPVMAEYTVTTEEVEKLVWADGLDKYPDIYNSEVIIADISNHGYEKDTYKLSELIPDTKWSMRGYSMMRLDDGTYTPDFEDVRIDFRAYDKFGYPVDIIAYSDDPVNGKDSGKIYYYDTRPEAFQEKPNPEEQEVFGDFTYQEFVDKLNEKGTGKPSFIAKSGDIIYIEAENGKYALPCMDAYDVSAAYLGREEREYKKGDIMTMEEYSDINNYMLKNSDDDKRPVKTKVNAPIAAPVAGDEIRDTDTRAEYIGTESIFSDVDGELVSYVNELNALGIINGYEDDTFRPDNTVTRAETAAIIARMLKYSGSYDGRFNDVESGEWYADDIAALVDNNIINGTSETTFEPDASIRYVDVLKILECVLGYANRVKNVGDYENDITAMGIELGLTANVGSFASTEPITRGSLAILISTALDTHLYTSNVQVKLENATIGTEGEDITLIDYINGGRLNGVLNAK